MYLTSRKTAPRSPSNVARHREHQFIELKRPNRRSSSKKPSRLPVDLQPYVSTVDRTPPATRLPPRTPESSHDARMVVRNGDPVSRPLAPRITDRPRARPPRSHRERRLRLHRRRPGLETSRRPRLAPTRRDGAVADTASRYCPGFGASFSSLETRASTQTRSSSSSSSSLTLGAARVSSPARRHLRSRTTTNDRVGVGVGVDRARRRHCRSSPSNNPDERRRARCRWTRSTPRRRRRPSTTSSPS